VMKILIVLALLCSLSAAYNDFTHTVIANGTQVQNGGTSDPAATCTFTGTYSAVSNKYSGSFTCTGLSSNVTQAHIHLCDRETQGYYYDRPYYYTCTNFLECPITTTPNGGSWDCTFPAGNLTQPDHLCNDECYFNVHTENYLNGEVRGNIFSMAPICNVVGGVSLNGVAVVAGSAPANSEISVPNFYYGSFITPVGTAAGYCFFIVSYQTMNEEIIISGCCSGLAGEVYSIYSYQKFDDFTTYVYYENTLYIPNDQPFSFKIAATPYIIALMITGNSKLIIAESGSSDTFEYLISSASFPTFTVAASCTPLIPADKNPATGYKCYKTSIQPDSTDTASYCSTTTNYCGLYNYGTAAVPNEDWDCFSPDICYTCSCGATLANLPSGAAVCCQSDGCNSGDFSSFLPGCTKSAGSNIAVGFLLSLFVALFINWFN